MKKYLNYVIVSFRVNFTYKTDFIISIVFEMVYFYIYFALWKTVYTSSGDTSIATYTLSAMVTYYFITAFIHQIEPSGAIYLGENIWNGNFTNDLVKPWSAKFIDTIYTTGEVAFKAVMYLPFFIFIYISAHSYIILPTLSNFILFFVTIFLAFFLMLSYQMIMHALTFHFGDQDANIGLVTYLVSFVGGGVVPLALLPNKLQSIVNILPFRFIFNEPANIFLGKVSFNIIVLDWLQILLWICVFYGVHIIVFNKGVKKYTGVGR
ncbi:MAG: ABC-2 family transporter protein [Patescibacteria group bacterium]|jgi:ABC-2 type transport system permease protein